jgi:hypothetical protein
LTLNKFIRIGMPDAYKVSYFYLLR